MSEGADQTSDKVDGLPWRHANCDPPANFCHGPITGNKSQLLRWLLPQAKDVRTLDSQLKSGIFWGRQEGRYRFSIWFSTQQKYAEANRRRLEDQQGDI